MASWKLRNIDDKTRILATTAATRDGLSVEQWLEREIRDKTGLPPLPAPPQSTDTPVTETPPPPRELKPPPTPIPPPRSYSRVMIVTVSVILVCAAAIGGWIIGDSSQSPGDRLNQLVSDLQRQFTGTGEKPASRQTAETKILPAAMQFDQLAKAAADGDMAAQLELGKRYLDGRDTGQDHARAREWMERAAAAGSADAMYAIAQIHEQGLGVPQNQETAADWYRRAVSAGSAQAATKLVERENRASRKRIEQEIRLPSATEPETGGTTLKREQIRELQQLLGRLDIDSGTPSGELTVETVSAIKLYQRFAGLPEDGKATLPLLRDLRQVIDAMSEKKP